MQNSLTCNKIPWLFPDFSRDWSFPDFSLTVATCRKNNWIQYTIFLPNTVGYCCNTFIFLPNTHKRPRVALLWYIIVCVAEAVKYCKISNISHTKSQNLNDSCLVLQLCVPNPLKPGVKSRMKSADRRCSNYIWVMNNLIAYWGAPYIRDLTVSFFHGGPEDISSCCAVSQRCKEAVHTHTTLHYTTLHYTTLHYTTLHTHTLAQASDIRI